MHAANPTVTIRFPIYDDKKVSPQEVQKKTRRTVADADGWVAKPKTAKRKKAPAVKRKAPAKKKTVTKKRATAATKRKGKRTPMSAATSEIIELSDDDDDDLKPLSAGKSDQDILWESEDSSDNEFEFDG